MRDYRRMQANSNPGVMAMPRDDNIMIWHAVIFGCVFRGERHRP
jgi:ubiquitin-protein ligase